MFVFIFLFLKELNTLIVMLIERFKIKGWKEKESGIVISENEDWILALHIPQDYQIDGYKLYPKKHLKSRKTHKQIDLLTTVFTKRAVDLSIPKDFEFGTTQQLITWIENSYSLIELQYKNQDDIFIGCIQKIDSETLFLEQVLADGSIDYEYNNEFKLSKIRALSFASNYFEALRILINEHISTTEV